MKNNLTIFFFLFFNTISSAQYDSLYVNIESVIQGAYDLYTENGIDAVIASLDRVNPSDSLYSNALLSKSYYYMQEEDCENAIQQTQVGINLGLSPNTPSFIYNMSLCLEAMEAYDEALLKVDWGLSNFPYNYGLHKRKADILRKQEKYIRSLESYDKLISLRPLDGQTHVHIGDLFFNTGRSAQALLAYGMYFVLDAENEEIYRVLNLIIDQMGKSNPNSYNEGVNLKESDKGFEEMNLIVDNLSALDKKSKYEYAIDNAFNRQLLFVLNANGSFDLGSSIMTERYLAFYNWVIEKGYTEQLINLISYHINNDKAQKYLKKKDKEIIGFAEIAYEKWRKITATIKVLQGGESKAMRCSYHNNLMTGIGQYNDEKPIGKWTFYHENGSLRSIGHFRSDGERDGDWVWYYNGPKNISESARYEDGKLNGLYIDYYPSGRRKELVTYKDGKVDGLYQEFDFYGALLQEKTLKNGNVVGKYKSFHPAAKNNTQYQYDNDENGFVGDIFCYYENQTTSYEASTDNGKLNDNAKDYYENGNVYIDKYYKNGQLHGLFKSYYPDGQLEQEGTYENGISNGSWKFYYPDGVLSQFSNYKAGELDGIQEEYLANGQLHLKYDYKAGQIISYSNYDRNGKLLVDKKRKKGNLEYKYYNQFGTLELEGDYNVKGGKEGVWKSYFTNGNIEKESTYSNDQENGNVKVYFIDGSLSEKYKVKNDTIEGLYESFYSNGKMHQHGHYVNGKEEQLWQYYYPDGELSSKYYFDKGLLHGFQHEYTADGLLSSKSYYENGNFIYFLSYDVNGNLIDSSNYAVLGDPFQIELIYPNKQVWISSSYQYGKKNGKTTYYYPNKKVSYEGDYLAGNREGRHFDYYVDGQISAETYYVNDILEGDYKTYYENGALKKESKYINGKLYGVEKTYSELTGALSTEAEYLNGNIHGEKRFYSVKGNLQLIRYYEHGTLVTWAYTDKSDEIKKFPIRNETAKIESYYSNGKTARSFEVTDGIFHGPYITYHENGQIEEETYYVNNLADGLNNIYYDDGTLWKTVNYNIGNKNGIQKEYYPSGKIKAETPYVNNTICGWSIAYDEKGEEVVRKLYNDGIIQEIIEK